LILGPPTAHVASSDRSRCGAQYVEPGASGQRIA